MEELLRCLSPQQEPELKNITDLQFSQESRSQSSSTNIAKGEIVIVGHICPNCHKYDPNTLSIKHQ